MRAHPAFRAASEALATHALDHFADMDPAGRWLVKDLGRSALCMAAVLLDGMPGALTTNSLTAAALAAGVCSRGRVRAFVEYSQECGRLSIAPGPEVWTRRRLVLGPAFGDFFRQRLAGGFQAASPVARELPAAIPALASDAALRGALVELAHTVEAARVGLTPNVALQFFLQRDGGMRLLQHCLVTQEAGRAGFLVAVRLARSEAARRCGVSRAHLNTMLTDAAAAGFLSLSGPGDISFSAELGEGLMIYFALHLQGLRLIAQAILIGRSVDF